MTAMGFLLLAFPLIFWMLLAVEGYEPKPVTRRVFVLSMVAGILLLLAGLTAWLWRVMP